MPKAKFRSRKIDDKRPLPVYRASEIPDFDEVANTQRSVPQVETGVEKEEEEEHHLQAAISASQAARTGDAAPLYIPTPDASKQIEGYEHLYKKVFHQPSTFIRFSASVEDSTGCPYNLDEIDEEWLEDFNKKATEDKKLTEDQFENVMYIFESAANDKYNSAIPPYEDMVVFSTNCPLAYSNSVDQPLHPAASSIYEHWKERRVASNGQSITPILKVNDILNESDPYVCFRRREIKSTRKTRRTDAQSHEKLSNLRHELYMVKELLHEVCSREKMRKESLVLERLIFDQKCLVREHRRLAGFTNEVDENYLVHKKKNKEKASPSSDPRATITIPLRKIKVIEGNESSNSPSPKPRSFSNQIGKNIKLVGELLKRKEAASTWVDITENPIQPPQAVQPSSYFRSVSNHHNGRFRCRVGRGGRMFIDRRRSPTAHRENDQVLQKFKYDDDNSDQEYTNYDDIYDRLLNFRAGLYAESVANFSATPIPLGTTPSVPSSLNSNQIRRVNGLKLNPSNLKTSNINVVRKTISSKGIKSAELSNTSVHGNGMNGHNSKMGINGNSSGNSLMCNGRTSNELNGIGHQIESTSSSSSSRLKMDMDSVT
ncbi:Enhancer of polycomb-like protein 1 [Basidiobolus ranarum]|uniref:Enhancer of polycomb-like protein n=1 Tax=Basidiobolus ranarum TaxID=34480 RepID=A0ABR2X4F8_9FUNG